MFILKMFMFVHFKIPVTHDVLTAHKTNTGLYALGAYKWNNLNHRLSVTIDNRVTWYLLNMHICYFNWVITVDFVD